MNKLILAILLSLSMTAHAQVSGPGNTFGGGGGGLGTCPTGDICQAANDLVLKTGNLIIETPGAGVIVTPQAAVGSGIVLSEMGNGVGNHALTLKLDDTDFPASLGCTINSEGFWSGTGCRGLGQSAYVWGSSTVTPTAGECQSYLCGVPFVIDNLETPALSSVPFYATTTASTFSSFVFKPQQLGGFPLVVMDSAFEGTPGCGQLTGSCYIPLSPVVEATLGISDLDILTDTVNGIELAATADSSTAFDAVGDQCNGSVFTGACARGGIIISDIDATAGRTTWHARVEATASTVINSSALPSSACSIHLLPDGSGSGGSGPVALNLPMDPADGTLFQEGTYQPPDGGDIGLGLWSYGGACGQSTTVLDSDKWQGDITITVTTQ